MRRATPLAFAVLVSSVAAPARADMITHTANFSAVMILDGKSFAGETDVKLPQFDAMNNARKLDAVTLTLKGFADASATAENNGAMPGTYRVSYAMIFGGNGPGNNKSQGALTFAMSPLAQLAAADGTVGSGPDFIDFMAFADPDGDTVTIPTAGAFNLYLGKGTVSVHVDGFGNTNQDGTLKDVTLNTGFVRLQGRVEVTYRFTVVPEPSSLPLAAIGLIAIVAWRRRISNDPRGAKISPTSRDRGAAVAGPMTIGRAVRRFGRDTRPSGGVTKSASAL